MSRCLALALAWSASAIHSPSLKDDVETGKEDAEDELDDESLLDVAQELATSDSGDFEDEDDDDDDSENDEETTLDDDLDLDNDDDDNDDDDDADDDGDDAELDALVNETAEDNADDDNGSLLQEKIDDDDDDEDDEDEDDLDMDDDEDDDDDEVEDDDIDDDDDDDAEDVSADRMPTMLVQGSAEQTDNVSFEFSADLPLQHGHTDKLAVFDRGRKQSKVTMVIVTKSSCPHCKQLATSMNEDPDMKATMIAFNAVHAPDSEGDAWHREAGYVPRVYFYSKDGTQLDVHGPHAEYPNFFDTSKVLQDGMREALSLG